MNTEVSRGRIISLLMPVLVPLQLLLVDPALKRIEPLKVHLESFRIILHMAELQLKLTLL